jgi:sugar lactone lactonase YvrE
MNNLRQKNIIKIVAISVSVLLVLLVVGIIVHRLVAGSAEIVHRIEIPDLFPEGIVYDQKHDRFMVGSIKHGTIHSIESDGTVSVFTNDPELKHSVGLEIDTRRNRLLVASSNSMIFKYPELEAHAELAVYNLDTGERLMFVDLSGLTDEGPNVVNDLAVDPEGNVYLTDSLVPVIYRVRPDGKADVFTRLDFLDGTKPRLNGIEYHEDGFLLVPNNGALYKIPVASPEAITRVTLDHPIDAADGIILHPDGRLIVVQNMRFRVTALESLDSWKTAGVANRRRTSMPGTATTAAIKDGEVHVVYSHLVSLITGIGNPDVFEIAHVPL